ncbi:MAG: hypothetical protein M0Z82_07710 [Actinomycetota bacterium]|jgi:hypothetical protein|nr:hypothetical protein [Actinomycetota bacterium]
MRTPGRLIPHLALGTLTVLAVGAIVLSLVQSTPIAPRQLKLAAANTLAVKSVSLDETIGQVVNGRLANLRTEVERYEAPGRLEAISGSEAELVIGGRLYVTTDGGRTWRLVNRAVDSARGVSLLMAPLRLLERGTHVVASRGQQQFSFSVPVGELVHTLGLGVSSPGTSPPARVTAVVTTSGEFVSTVTSNFDVNGAHYQLTDHYSDFDRLPALVAPAVGGP